MKRNQINYTKVEKGFTLVELAIVLVIVGLMVGMGASLIGPLTQRAKLHETKEIITAATESLIGNAASRNVLPVDTAAFAALIRKANDTWGRDLIYELDPNLADDSIGGICGRSSTALTLNICDDASCTTFDQRSNVAFIIISSGPNLNIQTDIEPEPILVYDPGITVDDYSGGVDVINLQAYDDIYKWVTLDELRIKAGCKGAQLNIVNNEIPFGYQGSSYSATIFADGGVPYDSGGDYMWCRQGSPDGLIFTPDASLADCRASGDPDNEWAQATTTVISGVPTVAGSYSITFFVRDENDDSGVADNIAERTMVLTVNPAPVAAGGCTDYRVWNLTTNPRGFIVDSGCISVAYVVEITTLQTLNASETIVRYANTNCQGAQWNFTYNNAVTFDTNDDCCVNMTGNGTGSERPCP